MPFYEVTLTGPATVAMTYRVEASSEADAIARAKSGEYPATHEEIMDQIDQEEEAWLIEEAAHAMTVTDRPTAGRTPPRPTDYAAGLRAFAGTPTLAGPIGDALLACADEIDRLKAEVVRLKLEVAELIRRAAWETTYQQEQNERS